MIRRYDPSDATAVLAINERNVPEVGDMDADKLAFFADCSPHFEVVEAEGSIVGFLIGLTEEHTGYPSKNYQWFVERYPSFAYVDRIAIDEAGRGQGHGPELYRRFEAWSIANAKPHLCAEVNTVPDNPRSHRFHELFGFEGVERQHPYGPDTEVLMYAKRLGGSARV